MRTSLLNQVGDSKESMVYYQVLSVPQAGSDGHKPELRCHNHSTAEHGLKGG